MESDLRCDKCGITYMSVHYAVNHYRKIAEGTKCEAYMFKACGGTLRKADNDESRVHTDKE